MKAAPGLTEEEQADQQAHAQHRSEMASLFRVPVAVRHSHTSDRWHITFDDVTEEQVRAMAAVLDLLTC